MKLPNNIKEDTSNVKDLDDGSLVLEVDETDLPKMYHKDFIPDDTEQDKYNKKLVQLIRSSYEYNQFIGILKTKMNLTNCKFIPLVDIENTKGVKLEMHHYPYTIYDIVKGVRDKMIADNKVSESFHTHDVMEEVMRLHFEGKVGIVPLSYTAHELAHNGELFIPLTEEFVFGDWKGIQDRILQTEGLKEKLNILEKYTERVLDDPELFDLDIFDNIQTNIQMKEAVKPLMIAEEELAKEA